MLNYRRAERDFWDNAGYNAMLAKSQAMPRNRGFVRVMRPDMVLERLVELGIEVTERTLQKYAKGELIPMPERRSAGRGKGRIADYAKETPAEFFASHRLMHGPKRCTVKQVSADRKKALSMGIKALLREAFFGGRLEHVTAIEWLSERDKILQGYAPDDDVSYSLSVERADLKSPVYERVVLEKRKPAKEQTPEEMLKIMERWVKALDGWEGD